MLGNLRATKENYLTSCEGERDAFARKLLVHAKAKFKLKRIMANLPLGPIACRSLRVVMVNAFLPIYLMVCEGEEKNVKCNDQIINFI